MVLIRIAHAQEAYLHFHSSNRILSCEQTSSYKCLSCSSPVVKATVKPVLSRHLKIVKT